jgi:antirestriction protein ArdC
MKTNKEIFNENAAKIAQQIIAQIEAGADNWQMPWHDGLAFAMNRATGSFYGGANLMLLWNECKSKNYTKNYWATFKQWRKLGGMVRTGEKATKIAILFLKKYKRNNAQLVITDDLKDSKTLYTKFIVKYIPVFNIDQVDGLFFDQPDLFGESYHGTELLDEMIKKTEANIRHGGNEAYYHITEDYIQMPYKANFTSIPPLTDTEAYHTTLLHEIIHWSGHPTRCNRAYLNLNNHERYAFEELVAELGCAILSTHFQQRVLPRPEHAQYLSSWLSVLKKDFNYFYQAQNQALMAISWIFAKTGILAHQFKEKTNVQLDKKRFDEWEKIIQSKDENIPIDMFYESFI